MRLLHMADKIFGARVPGAAISPVDGAGQGGQGVHPCPWVPQALARDCAPEGILGYSSTATEEGDWNSLTVDEAYT